MQASLDQRVTELQHQSGWIKRPTEEWTELYTTYHDKEGVCLAIFHASLHRMAYCLSRELIDFAELEKLRIFFENNAKQDTIIKDTFLSYSILIDQLKETGGVHVTHWHLSTNPLAREVYSYLIHAGPVLESELPQKVSQTVSKQEWFSCIKKMEKYGIVRFTRVPEKEDLPPTLLALELGYEGRKYLDFTSRNQQSAGSAPTPTINGGV